MITDTSAIRNQILNEVHSGKLALPGLSDIALRVRQIISSEDADVARVAKVIQSDIPLTARLIQVANSPLYRGVVKVDTCHNAIARLGLDVTRDLVTSFELRRVFSAKSSRTRKRVENLWKHSVKVAAISFVLARVTPDLLPDRALLCGLIHDIGLLPLMNFLESNPEYDESEEAYMLLAQSLRAELGAEIINTWRFDDFLRDVVVHAEDWDRNVEGGPDYADVVIVAQRHAELGEKKRTIEPIPAMSKFPIFKLGSAASVELIAEAQDEIIELQKLLKSS